MLTIIIVINQQADKMEIDIGFPEWMKNNAKMDAKYKDVCIIIM